MDRIELLERMRNEREAWDALLAEIPPQRMAEPGVDGDWSVKDIVAHVSWYERETAIMVEDRALIGSDLWQLPQDERNIPIYEENKHRPLDEVKAEAESVFQRLIRGIETLPDDALRDASLFREMPEEWIPWMVIASNTFEHYHQHIPGIRAWLDRIPNREFEVSDDE
jgi:hypothetical protein